MHDRLVNLLGATGLVVRDFLGSAVELAGGGNPSASAALVAVARHPGIGTSDLARHIKLTQPAASRLVDGLVSGGLIERGPGSGRSVPLRLTTEGQAMWQRFLESRREVLDTLVASLDDDERATLERSLEKILVRAYDHVGSEWVVCRLCDGAACKSGGAVCPVGHAARAERTEQGKQQDEHEQRER